jgi:hypothetical protein
MREPEVIPRLAQASDRGDGARSAGRRLPGFGCSPRAVHFFADRDACLSDFIYRSAHAPS